MKRILLTFAASLLALTSWAQAGSITIGGTVESPAMRGTEVTVYEQGDRQRTPIASSPVADDGSYAMTLDFDAPGIYMLAFKGQVLQIWAEDENLTIDLPDRERVSPRPRTPGPVYAKIKGGPKNEFMNKFQWIQVSAYWYGMDVRAVASTTSLLTDQDAKIELSKEVNVAFSKGTKARLRHLVEYYGDQPSVIAALPYIEDAGELYDRTVARLQATYPPDYAPLKKYLASLVADSNVAIGEQAPDFAYPTPEGNVLSLASLRGNYVLIDFWASWCAPCRTEIPTLKAAYEKYHAKGLEILSVSIDNDDAAWRKAMADEAMPWLQIKTPDAGTHISQVYQFNGIPHIVLLDKDGRIISKNDRGQALLDKLEELLGRQ